MKMKVGIVGWRGMVGSVLMQRMLEENDLDGIEPVFFSTSQAGQGAPIGAACSACEVEKKTGSIPSRSFSSSMRCIRTEPTIPRQPTIPTFIFIFLFFISSCYK